MATSIICSQCDCKIPKKEVRTNPDNNNICENCYDDNCGYCHNCDKLFWSNDLTEFNNEYYCNECLDDLTCDCNNCGERISIDASYSCDDCGYTYCENCQHNEDGYQEQDIDFQEGNKTPLITINRFVGVEIEAENGERSNISLPDSFGVQDDGSLDDSGVEITTPPSKDGALVKNVKLACEQLNQAGFTATSSCGLHIHIDVREIKENYIKLSRVLRTLYAIEDVMFSMLPDSRLDNTYCKPLRQYYNFYDFYGRNISKEFDAAIYKTKNKYDLQCLKKEHYNDIRYRASNFHSVFYRGTLEIRCHSGTTNPNKILKWCELLLTIVDWAINHYNHSTVEGLLKIDASKHKTHKMQHIFKFSKVIERYINARSREFNHKTLHIDYSLGELPKRKTKK